MLAEELYRFRGELARQNVIFCYSGFLTEETWFGIGSAIRKEFELESADKRRAKDVFSIFIEQIQNVIRYSAEMGGEILYAAAQNKVNEEAQAFVRDWLFVHIQQEGFRYRDCMAKLSLDYPV